MNDKEKLFPKKQIYENHWTKAIEATCSFQKTMEQFKKSSSIYKFQKQAEHWNSILKPFREANSSLIQIAQKQAEHHKVLYSSPLSEVIERQTSLIRKIEKNMLFNSFWKGILIEDTSENQKIFESEVKEFSNDITEFVSYLPEQEIEKDIPVNNILEEVNKAAEIPINKQTLSTAIGFIYTSSCSEDRDISNAAKEILAELGKFSESVEGKGIAFILVIITFLKTIFS